LAICTNAILSPCSRGHNNEIFIKVCKIPDGSSI
jgi:hypothetical protein